MDRTTNMALNAIAPDMVQFDAPLAPFTTFGLGGKAEALAQPNSVEELSQVLKIADDKNIPVFILGAGSNVLFRDGGFTGLVVKLDRGFSNLSFGRVNGKPEVTVEAGAALPLSRLIQVTVEEDLKGLEFLAGIPGTVGGALAMNAGAFGGEITDALEQMTIMAPDGSVQELEEEDIETSYRHLKIDKGTIILEARFSLIQTEEGAVKETVSEYLDRRKKIQPAGVKSAGSVFRNPKSQPAGLLIDQAGLKGQRVGEAWVSEKHANFIVHKGGATAGDVIELINQVKEGVKDKFGIELEPEIKIVGNDKGRE